MIRFRSLLPVFLLIACPTYAQNVDLDSLDVAATSARSVTDMMVGRFSGVHVSSIDGNPNNKVMTNIRGINGVRGDNQPLWIVDGVMLSNNVGQNIGAFWQKGGVTTKGDELPDYSQLSYSTPLNDLIFLNPSEIESIEVIKDLSAVAKYGSLGANGVVIVNTGKDVRDEMVVSFKANVAGEFASSDNPAARAGVSHNYTLSLGGSLRNTNYNISAYYKDMNYPIRNTGSEFGGLSLGFRSEASSIVQFGLNTILTIGELENAAGAAYFGHASNMLLARNHDMFAGETLTGWQKDYDDDLSSGRALLSAYFNVKFLNSLKLNMSFGADLSNDRRSFWYGDGTAFGKSSKGAASIITSTFLNYNANVNLTYNQYFALRHHVTAIISADVIGSNDRYGVMNGTTFELPYLRAKGLASMGSRAVPYRFARTYSLIGANASVSYDYDNVVGVNALLRSDFKLKYHQNNPVLYPSADMYLDLRKFFFSSSKAVSGLKLVGGYGLAGKDTFLPYEMLFGYLNTVPSVETGSEVYYDGFGEAISSEWNIGFNLGLFADRVNISAKYYDKLTADKFSVWSFCKKTGDYWVESQLGKEIHSSIANLNNRGVEFDLNATPVMTHDFKWNIWGNVSYNMNSVADIAYDDMAGAAIGKNTSFNITASGYQVGALFGFTSLDDGTLIDLTGDGILTDADKVVLGNTTPAVHGAFGTDVSWKRFTIDLMVDGAAGHTIADLNSMIKDGTDQLSDKYVENASWFRLSRISLNYNVPLADSKFIKGLNICLSGTNLFTISKYSGWNPSANSFGNNVSSTGLDYGSFPMFRSVVLGVSANF